MLSCHDSETLTFVLEHVLSWHISRYEHCNLSVVGLCEDTNLLEHYGYVSEDLLSEKQRRTKHISPYECIKMREKT
jgi:hypothetical protein